MTTRSFETAGDDPDMTESEIGTKPAPRDVSWQELSLPRMGRDGAVTIDDIAYPSGRLANRRSRATTANRSLFVLERLGMKHLPGVENGQLGPLTDPGVALLLRSDDGGDTFRLLTQLPPPSLVTGERRARRPVEDGLHTSE